MWNEDEQAVLDAIYNESKAHWSGDFEELKKCWVNTPEARRIFAGSEMGTRVHRGWDAMAAGFQQAMSMLRHDFDIDEYLDRQNVQICISGDMAWVCYDQVLIKHDPDFFSKPLQHETKVLHRIDGMWRIACMVIIVPDWPSEVEAQVRIGPGGKVSSMNELARSNLRDHPGLLVSGQSLRARNAEFDSGLQARIEEMIDAKRALLPSSHLNLDNKAVPLGFDDYSRPLHCWVYVDQDDVVVSFDSYGKLVERLDWAAETFGLSPQQRRLAERIIEGDSLQNAAEAMRVSVNALRTQLRRMFEKTGTHDQAALMTLLLSVEPPGPRVRTR